LQELAARRFDQLPRYDVIDEGPDHAKRFFATVFLDGSERGRGEGRSKKQAEQAAAKAAWKDLQREVVEELAGTAADAE
jgi:ribonuclease III